MRFQVSQVMDAIEGRLTTDVTGAQAVVDLGEVIRSVELDRGRPVSLVRIGMVIDALGRYLVDGGAMLYGVVERALLSEQALTSKERMVLGRWADEGLIEVVPVVGDRVVEIADLTGLPLIARSPYLDQVKRYDWLADEAGRVLRLTGRAGVAALTPMGAEVGDVAGSGGAGSGQPAVGRAPVPESAPEPVAVATGSPEAEPADSGKGEPGQPGEAAGTESAGTGSAGTGSAGTGSAGTGAADSPPAAAAGESTVPLPVEVFTGRGATVSHTRISRHRFLRAAPNQAYAALLRRQWRCEEFECPVFGEHRRLGQPVPRMRGEVAVCPRHDQPVIDLGPRDASYPVSIVVDDLPRRRLVVREGRPLSVGRGVADPGASEPESPAPEAGGLETGGLETAGLQAGGLEVGDPGAGGPEVGDLVSVAPWLHQAAAAWISPVHLRLEAGEGGLVVTDLSRNGTVVWQRKGPDDPGTTRPLRRDSYNLGEWDSVELYTGIELMRGDRRLATALGRDEPASVLLDAPTAAHHQVGS